MSTRREFLMETAAFGAVMTASLQSAEATSGNIPAAPEVPMKTYKIPHTDLLVSRIAYGNAMLGSDQHSPDFIQKTVRILNIAYDNGITFFDLADHYGAGKSEAALGEMLKQSPGLRRKLVIQTKCGMIVPDGWTPGDPLPSDSIGADLSHAHIVSAAEGSLMRLGTDHLDILLLHQPDALVEPEEVAQAFDELHRSGKVRYFGVSNHSVGQIELLKKSIRQPLVANQIQLGLAHCAPIGAPFQTGFGGIVDYCRLHQMQVQAFSPLKGDDIFGSPSLLNVVADAPPAVKQAAQTLADLAKKRGSTPSAIALAWLLRHPAGIVPIIGATRPEHVIDNCTADRISLTRQEWYTLFYSAAAIQSQKST